MLSQDDVHRIQTSFKLLAPRADAVAMMFYNRLFELAPDYRALFPQDMTQQRAKLMSTLASVVQSLNKIDDLLPAVQALGRRHVGYNVTPDQYGPVGHALMDTLQAGLGKQMTPEVQAAWQHAYAVLSKAMIDAANDPTETAA